MPITVRVDVTILRIDNINNTDPNKKLRVARHPIETDGLMVEVPDGPAITVRGSDLIALLDAFYPHRYKG